MSEDLAALNLVELYDRLVPPEAPAPVSMWPQTTGWIWLGAAVVILVALAVSKYIAWQRATAYRRAALAELKVAGNNPAVIANILRRAALSAFPRQDVAGLYGSEWLGFLDRSASQLDFSSSAAGLVLAAAPYRPQETHPDLPAMAERWIRSHRARKKQG